MKFDVVATRTYHSSISFVVDADSEQDAYDKALRMIDECEVEFDGIDGYGDNDEIEIWNHHD